MVQEFTFNFFSFLSQVPALLGQVTPLSIMEIQYVPETKL